MGNKLFGGISFLIEPPSEVLKLEEIRVMESTNTQEMYGKMFIILAIRKRPIKITRRFYLTTVGMVIIKKANNKCEAR